MCDSTKFPVWQANAILEVLKLNNTSCDLLIINEKNNHFSRQKKIREKLLNLNNFFWNIYYSFLKKKFKQTKLIDLKETLSLIDEINITSIKKGKFSEYFEDKDISFIKDKNLDFILRFSFGIIRGEILKSAKFGVWSFHHGNEEKYRGGPPGFWEIYLKDNITGFILQKLTDRLDGGVILKKGFVKTQLSYVDNRDQIYKESSRFVSSVCVDILNDKTDKFEREPSKTNSPIYLAPNNIQVLNFLFKTSVSKFKSLKRFLYVDYWNIGVVNLNISSFLKEENTHTVHWFDLKSKKRFVADPFGIKKDKGISLFYESYDYKNKKSKGVINKVDYIDGVFYDNEIDILNFKTHLSYPQVIEFDKKHYLLPENFESNDISIYELSNDLENTVKKFTLIEGVSGVDNTILFYKGIYWLFTGKYDDSPHHNLHLFYSNNLLEGWEEHPKNPVKTDVRSSRSAGTPFEHKGVLYRPSMDYSEKLEGKVSINEIELLNKQEYIEKVVKTVNPFKDSKYSDKIHTLSSVGDYTLIDGAKELLIFSDWRIFKYRFFNLLNKIIKK